MGTDNTSVLGYNNNNNNNNNSRYHNSIMMNNLTSNHHSIGPSSSLNYPGHHQWQQSPSAAGPCHLYYQQQQWSKYYAHNNNKRYYQQRHLAGKTLKDGSSGDEKKDDSNEGLWANVEAQAAFLGPNLWDKNLPYDADLKYVDLDEFLSENGIPVDQPISPPSATVTSASSSPPSTLRAGIGEGGGGGGEGSSQQLGARRGNNLLSELHITTDLDSNSEHAKRERSQSPYDPPLSPSTIGPASPTDSTISFSSTTGRDFDPRTRAFSDEELKPQPMIKKSRKQFVPDDLKDEKYWARRRKNNLAAKRSRDARRVKENQIALRAGYLEKENSTLRQEIERLKKENSTLRVKLDKATSKSN